MADEARIFLVHFNQECGANIRLPRCFLEKWGWNFQNRVKLLNRDGRLWCIRLESYDGDVWLGKHWHEFKIAHNITCHDCVYFKYRTSNAFDVVIFGMNYLEKGVTTDVNEKKAVHFYKKLNSRSFSTYLVLPYSFTSIFLNSLPNPLTLVLDGSFEGSKVSWLSNFSIPSVTFQDGWHTFMEKHNIQMNDTLVFSYEHNDIMRVQIIRSESGLIDEFHKEMHVAPVVAPIQRVELWRSEMTAASSSKGKPLYVPARVANNTLKHHPQTITMEVPSGAYEQWDVIWSKGRKECKFGKGWYEFKESNNVADGSILSFGKAGEEDVYYVEIVQL